jgi:hypothetical protein
VVVAVGLGVVGDGDGDSIRQVKGLGIGGRSDERIQRSLFRLMHGDRTLRHSICTEPATNSRSITDGCSLVVVGLNRGRRCSSRSSSSTSA